MIINVQNSKDVSNNMQVKPVDPTNLKILTRDDYLAVCIGSRS